MKRTCPSNHILRLLFWEATIKCNLSCAHCRRLEANTSVAADLSTSQAKKLITQLAQLSQKQPTMPILVFSGGEPLCRNDIFELIEYSRSLKIPPALATNATLIDADTAQKIADCKVQRVAVSIDGADAETHNKLRRQQNSFEQALKGIDNLRQKQIPFQINITLTAHNAHQLKNVYELACSLGAAALHIFMLVPVGCGQILAQTDMLTPRQYEQKLIQTAHLEAAGRLQIKVTCAPHYQRVIKQHRSHHSGPETAPTAEQMQKKHIRHTASRGCLAGLGVLFVGHTGDVFPCGYLPVNCGNILEKSLSQIWNKNNDLSKMRNSDMLEDKCGICDYKNICGGCRARAYAETGNYMAAEPFCAYTPPKAAR